MQVANLVIRFSYYLTVIVLPFVIQQTPNPAVAGRPDHDRPLAFFFTWWFHSEFNVTARTSVKNSGQVHAVFYFGVIYFENDFTYR